MYVATVYFCLVIALVDVLSAGQILRQNQTQVEQVGRTTEANVVLSGKLDLPVGDVFVAYIVQVGSNALLATMVYNVTLPDNQPGGEDGTFVVGLVVGPNAKALVVSSPCLQAKPGDVLRYRMNITADQPGTSYLFSGFTVNPFMELNQEYLFATPNTTYFGRELPHLGAFVLPFDYSACNNCITFKFRDANNASFAIGDYVRYVLIDEYCGANKSNTLKIKLNPTSGNELSFTALHSPSLRYRFSMPYGLPPNVTITISRDESYVPAEPEMHSMWIWITVAIVVCVLLIGGIVPIVVIRMRRRKADPYNYQALADETQPMSLNE